MFTVTYITGKLLINYLAPSLPILLQYLGSAKGILIQILPLSILRS